MFAVTAIQAEYGDSLLVSYGSADAELRHILIDGGTEAALGSLLAALDQHRTKGHLRLEAVVVTHYDLDHIGGIIALLKAPPPWLEIADIWFNGHKHLAQADVLGPAEGDELSKIIEGVYPWNAAFGGRSIKSDRAPLTREDGLKVWILSPDQTSLTKLATKWPASEASTTETEDRLGANDVWPPGDFSSIASRPFVKDGSVANGSSIALMLEFDGKRVLLTGDAHPDVVANGIALHWPGVRLEVSLLKLSHHGSKGNTNERLLKAFDCDQFLVSTNGEKYKHPDVTALVRILKVHRKPTFVFNHAVARTLWWQTVPPGWPKFKSIYPVAGTSHVRVEI